MPLGQSDKRSNSMENEKIKVFMLDFFRYHNNVGLTGDD